MTTVFSNVRVFPGSGSSLLPAHDITVDGTTIGSMAPHDPGAQAPDGATVSAVVHPAWDAVRDRATLCLEALDDAGRVTLATRLP